MAKTRKIGYFLLALLLVLLIYAGNFGLQYANIASSYAAKTVCSCVLVSGLAVPDGRTATARSRDD